MTKTVSVGDRFETNHGWCEIIEYIDCSNVWIRFEETNYETKCNSSNLRKGNIRDLYYRSVFDVGYFGTGPYKKRDNTNRYMNWYNMLTRCYCPKSLAKCPTYKGCYVHSKFQCYQDFATWHNDQYCSNLPRSQLDKDLLFKHNKIYSPRRSILLPYQVNSLLCKADNIRGEYFIGVSKNKIKGLKKPYTGHCCTLEGVKTKTFVSEINAFNWYKKTKEQNIKNIADLYKDVLDPRAYLALLNYRVEITD